MADQLYFRQLLAGRDFAVGDAVATQMVNFAYLIGDRESGEAVLVLGWAGVTPWAAAANGDPVELPPATGKRDGSGAPLEKPLAAVGRAHS